MIKGASKAVKPAFKLKSHVLVFSKFINKFIKFTNKVKKRKNSFPTDNKKKQLYLRLLTSRERIYSY